MVHHIRVLQRKRKAYDHGHNDECQKSKTKESTDDSASDGSCGGFLGIGRGDGLGGDGRASIVDIGLSDATEEAGGLVGGVGTGCEESGGPGLMVPVTSQTQGKE